jgi:hypothetical protein
MEPLVHRGGLSIAVIAAARFATEGCQSPRQVEHSVRLVPAARPYEPDIPVPVGFRFVEEASEDRSTGMARLYLRHVYEGKANKFNVRDFYRDQMALARWVKVSDGNVKGEYSMRWEKGDDACNIVIRDRGRSRLLTEVQVIISQEARGKTPPVRRNTP